jgi:hypothetical protein
MDGWGTVKGRSSALEQTERFFMEGRGGDAVNPEGLGVELFRQLGLSEDGGLSAQRRHFAERGKSVRGEEDEKRRLGVMRTELTLSHGAFIWDDQRVFFRL